MAEDKRTELGADTKAIVCNRILDALNIHSNVGKRNSPKHLIDGKEFFWMISLSEKHSSGYIAFDVSGCDIDFNRAKLNGSVKYIYQPSKWLIGKIKLDFGLVELLIMQ